MHTAIEERADVGRGEHDRTAFGLALRIDPRISIPGLKRCPGPVSAQPPSRIRLDAAELSRRWDALTAPPVRTREVRLGETLVRTVDFAEPAGHLLWARDYGRVLISPDGLELLCEPDPANDDWASIVSSQALPLAATIRGLEVMHASGVVLDGRAVLITGPPGAGKSSLAAALVRAGARLLSDDAVALQLSDGALIAHAGSVVLQLRASEDERLSADERTTLGRPVSAIEGKHRYVSAAAPVAAALGCVFLLERSAREPVVERLPAVDPFELIASTFNLSVCTPARLRRQLDVVCAIAANGLAHRLRVQPGLDAVQLAAIVQEHLAWVNVPAQSAVQSGAQPGREHPVEL
jgi:hypothetical protein